MHFTPPKGPDGVPGRQYKGRSRGMGEEEEEGGMRPGSRSKQGPREGREGGVKEQGDGWRGGGKRLA